MTNPDQRAAPPGEDAPRSAAFRGGVGLGSPLGVPIRLHLTFVLLGVLAAVAIYPLLRNDLTQLSSFGAAVLAAAISVAMLASVALHEFAHAVVARRLGIGVRGIHLWGLGGATALDDEPPTARAQYLVSVAGPMVNLLIGGAGAALWLHAAPGSVPHEIGFRLAIVNALLAAYNLLPGMPLDGGQVLRAGVWAMTGNKNLGLRAAGYGGFGAAGLTAALAVFESRHGGDYGLFTGLVAVFIAYQAQQSLIAAAIADRMPSVVAGNLAVPAFLVEADLPLAEALRRAEADGRQAVVLGRADQPPGVLSDVLLAAVPPQQRPWVPLSSVVRPGVTLDAALTGEDLLAVLRTDTLAEHVVMRGPKLVGVLRTADVARALTRRSPRPASRPA